MVLPVPVGWVVVLQVGGVFLVCILTLVTVFGIGSMLLAGCLKVHDRQVDRQTGRWTDRQAD